METLKSTLVIGPNVFCHNLSNSFRSDVIHLTEGKSRNYNSLFLRTVCVISGVIHLLFILLNIFNIPKYIYNIIILDSRILYI